MTLVKMQKILKSIKTGAASKLHLSTASMQRSLNNTIEPRSSKTDARIVNIAFNQIETHLSFTVSNLLLLQIWSDLAHKS